MTIHLPISKSIAQRQLVLRAMGGEDLRPLLGSEEVASWPEDVVTMLHGLTLSGGRFDVGNNGTAMRFLTAYYAQQEGCEVVLDGCERMRHRPMRQLVEALREVGADICYEGEVGFAPLRIRGRRLNRQQAVTLHDPQSSQFISALLLIGVPVETNCQSPYVEMTKAEISSPKWEMEADWSAAAFWLERKALGLIDEVSFVGLRSDSMQGDKVAAEIFEKILNLQSSIFNLQFSSCPDLYPAVAVTCHELGIRLQATGIESLRLKESDRIAAIEEAFATIEEVRAKGVRPIIRTHHDHRIAMAFLAAGYAVDDEACCRKSYPDFVMQLRGITRIVPRRGVNDDNLGKKWALHKLITAAESEWLWLTDDDVTWPATVPSEAELAEADMIILPLTMAPAEGEKRDLLADLQIWEYAAIQALTQVSTERGHAVMCSGANLLVRRAAWLDCEADLHQEIPSGDDMFLLEAMKKRHYRIRYSRHHVATCYAEPTLAGLLHQRMRWAGKAPKYRDADIIAMGAWTVFSNLMVVLSPVWMLAKWLVDMRLIVRHTNTKLTAKFLVETLLLTLLYPFYMLLSLIGGLFRKSW